MRIASLTVSREAKINLGNYESKSAFASLTVEIEPGDNIENALQRAWATVQGEVKEQESSIRKGDTDMPIKGLTNLAPSFPEIGHIRKGAPKAQNAPGRDLEYFRVEFNDADTDSASRFNAIYGDKPRAIRVMLMYDDIDMVFDAWREAYSAGQLLHRCDGEVVHYPASERGQPCRLKDNPDPKLQCKPVGRLRVILPELARAGYVTVHTTSWWDIRNLSANLLAIKQLAGRLTGIPLILRRVEKEISTPTQDGKRKRYKKWLLFIEIEPAWVEARLGAMRQNAMLEAGMGDLLLDAGEIDDGDYVVDADTGEIGNAPMFEAPAPAKESLPPPPPAPAHWIEKPGAAPRFWGRYKGAGLSEAEVHFALGVTSVKSFTGTMGEAKEVLDAFAALSPATRAVAMCDGLIVGGNAQARIDEAVKVIENAASDGVSVEGLDAGEAVELLLTWWESKSSEQASVLDEWFGPADAPDTTAEAIGM